MSATKIAGTLARIAARATLKKSGPAFARPIKSSLTERKVPQPTAPRSLAQPEALAMPPLSLDDDELSILMHLAEAVPVEHRDAFLRNVAEALGAYSVLGPGIVSRTAASLQRRYITAPPSMGAERSKYR
jgi:hypothetical protein